ncbi:MAG TPA: 50S ribosomal protein L24 [Actinomycetota bacterium]|jgi:large subunit ribosomal protein L24|nr:50S ribosomal protein L24 [Actinomycetota bacterium]
MARPRIKKGDEVIVIAGKDVGVRGRVLEVLPKANKVIVEGVNRVTRHEKLRMAQGRGGQEGGIMHKEAPVHISNVAIVDPSEGKGTRIGYRVESGTGAKVRISKRTGTEL